MNIAEITHKLVDDLKLNGFNEFQVPDIEKECEEDWNENYAIFADFRPDTWQYENDYFDYDSLEFDLRTHIVEQYFDVVPRPVFNSFGNPKYEAEGISVQFYGEYSEVEIVRAQS